MIQLRSYQQQAVDAVYNYLRNNDDNPVVVIPTGGGKTPIMATLCSDAVNFWQGRVLVLAHVKELLEQTYKTLGQMAPELEMGIYSAGLERRDISQNVIIAGIQSVYKRAFELGRFDLIIVDEAHMISLDSESMYQTFFGDAQLVNPHIRIIGLTATPFRMSSGAICQQDNIFNAICYSIGVKELIVAGYLCNLRTKAAKEKINTDSVHIRGGEFIANELEQLMDKSSHVTAACSEIVDYTKDRHSVLIFASGIKHGHHIVNILKENHGIECGFVSGDSPDGWRKKMLDEFRDGSLKYLCNINVLTTGFDAPNIDCVAMLRPTMSTGLYYQQVGRGFRLYPNKKDCLILDYSGNVERHGPVDNLIIHIDGRKKDNASTNVRECPECHELVSTSCQVCPDCQYIFEVQHREARHKTSASSADILAPEPKVEEHAVLGVFYSPHTKKGSGPDGPKSMRVQYNIGFNDYVCEWICFEHTGFAREKAEIWWKQRSELPVPNNVSDALIAADEGLIRKAISITVKRKQGDFDKIVAYTLEPKHEPDCEYYSTPEPEYVPPSLDSDIPF